MASITLKSRKEAIEVPNDKARHIKARWGGIDVPKALPEDIVDLDWITFQYGQIKSIELTNLRNKPSEDYNRPLTKEEQARAAAVMARVRKDLEAKGILKTAVGKMDSRDRCDVCKCLLDRDYICRHECKKCVDSNFEW